MTNRKNYNSILFLTVYLGLVLVGATPQVLAHAATNSFFDLRNEIEFKDDLDRKPDDLLTEIKDKNAGGLVADYLQIVSDSIGQVNPFAELADLRNHSALVSGFTGFETSFGFNAENTLSVVTDTERNLQIQLSRIQNFSEKIFFENTKALVVDGFRLLVTQLPRSSIDSPLQ